MNVLKPASVTPAPQRTADGGSTAARPARVLACNMNALTPDQRSRHVAATKTLLAHAVIEELPEGFALTVNRSDISVPELAEWIANEARCCPAVDFHLDAPAFGPLTLRLDGGADVKEFVAAELGLRQ